MKQYILVGLVTLSMAACSDKDSKSAPAAAGSRTQEHKPSECPAQIEGVYAAQDGDNRITILKVNGQLVVRDSDSVEVPVNGQPTIIAQDGSSNTLICKGGVLEMRSVFPDGSTSQSDVSKDGTGLKVELKNSEGDSETVRFVRVADAPSEDTAAEEVTCSTGFTMSYQLNVNGCDTGKHILCSLPEYCAALKDDVLNKGCAKSMREERHQAVCN